MNNDVKISLNSGNPSLEPSITVQTQPIKQLNDLMLVTLPPEQCLFSAESTSFLTALAQMAETIHRNPSSVSGVLILQHQDADDRSIGWLQELEHDVLFSTLVNQLDAFRWLLSLIRNSPKPWIYMSASNSLGSAWELALSCQRRYWFEPQALVGFPEIKTGAFPPGGTLESLNKRQARIKEKWQQKSIYSASEAMAEGWIDFCSKASLWEKEAIAVFRELLTTHPLIGVREAPPKRWKRNTKNESAFDLSASILQRQAALKQLEAVWKKDHSTHEGHPHAWDYCWQLVKERSQIEDSIAFGRLIAHIAARHYLTPPFQAWLRIQVVNVSDPSGLFPRSSAFRPEITIDLNHVAPPTEVLLRLLRRGCSLTVASNDPKLLTDSLKIMYGRIERALGAGLASRLWSTSVSWYVSQGQPYGHILMQWTSDDRFLVKYGQHEASFRRLEGNAATALPGILEWEGSELNEQLEKIIPFVADGALRLGQRAQGLPSSVFLRSIFLEEMIRISRHSESDLQGVAAALKKHHWRFAGDDEAWDRFLKTRYDNHFTSSIQTQTENLLPLTKSSWELAAWKHARAMTRRKIGEMASRQWNSTALSQHMAIFLGVVAKAFAKKNPLLPMITFDHLASEALGFPQDYGTPIGYILRRGPRQIQLYTKLHWPMLYRISEQTNL